MEGVVHIRELEELEVEENAYSVELGEEVENAWGVVGIHDSRQEMEVVGIVDGRQGMVEVGIVDGRRVMVEVVMEVVAAEYNEQVGMGMGEIEKVDSRQEVGKVMEGVEVEVEEMLMGVVVTVVAEMVMGVGARVMGVAVEEEEEMVVEGEEIAMM